MAFSTCALLAAGLMHGCATQAPPPNYAVVRTYYATDRNRTDSANPKEMYGVGNAELSYGIADVSIPRRHERGSGELESPSIWRLEFREDPERHVVLLAASPMLKNAYFAELANSVAAAKRRSAFVFVHGYNVTFEDAARRTAQISYDVSFDGVPVFYSWPSHGTTAGYPHDEESIQLTMPNLRGFLEGFFDRSGAQDVYLVAHSMGNRALTRVLADLLEARPQVRERLKEIILAAPDINVDIFKQQIYPALAKAARPITLYASSEDVALKASKGFHDFPRLGDSRPAPVLLPGVESIDATGVDVSFLAHSYFAETSAVLYDLRRLIGDGMRAAKRTGLAVVETGPQPYWVFKPK